MDEMNDKDWYAMLLRMLECEGELEDVVAECGHIMDLYGCPEQYKSGLADILEMYYINEYRPKWAIKQCIQSEMTEGERFNPKRLYKHIDDSVATVGRHPLTFDFGLIDELFSDKVRFK
jgi:hypothetical protein